MSRLTSDRNQQQPQQPNQNQQIVQQSVPVQNLRIQNQASIQQQQQPQQFLTLAQSGSYLIANNPNDSSNALRTSSNINSSNIIYYPNSSATNSSSASSILSSSAANINNPTVIANQANVTTTTPVSQIATSASHPTSPIAKKRLKLDNIAADGSSSTTEDLAALKKRIYEHKVQRLKNLKEK